MAKYEDWTTCFWCVTAVWGYGDTEAQAKYQARNNKIGHEATCPQNPANKEND